MLVMVYCAALSAFFSLHDCPTFCPLRLHTLVRLETSVVEIFSALTHIVVIFYWSKTIQCKEWPLVIPLVPISGSPLCPLSAFNKMFDLVPASSISPAFCYRLRSRLIPLTKPVFNRTFRKLLVHANIPAATCYTGHSFCRGGT